jgi:hypothetical protein
MFSTLSDKASSHILSVTSPEGTITENTCPYSSFKISGQKATSSKLMLLQNPEMGYLI